MTTRHALFIGEVALDEYYAAPTWPGIGTKVTVETRQPELGGTVANAASVYAGYGNATRFFYTLNDGATSDRMLADLEAHHVDTSLVRRDPTLPDSKTFIFLANDEHTVFIPQRAFATLDLSTDAAAALDAAQFVYTTVTDARMLRSNAMTGLELLSRAREHGARIVYDLDVGEVVAGDEAYVREADLVFLNAAGIANLGKDRGENAVVDDLLSGGAEAVVVTRAADGCTVFAQTETVHADGIPVEVEDVTGAGDTFCSSFLHGLTTGANLQDVARFANAAAARSVTMHGPRAGVSTASEVLAFAAHRGIHLPPVF